MQPTKNNRHHFDFCSGIDGFQATSMTVFASEIRKEFNRRRVAFNEIAVRIPKIFRLPILRFFIGVFCRYLYYPLKVRFRHKTNLVFIADSANAGIYNLLPQKVKTAIFLHGLAYQQDFKVFDVKADFKDQLIRIASRIFKRPGLLGADLTIANSERGRGDFLDFAGKQYADKITVAPLGIAEQFKPVDSAKLRAQLGITDNVQVIFSVAAPDLRKNIDVVVAALQKLDNLQHEWVWVHVGGLHSSVRSGIPVALSKQCIAIDQVAHSEMPMYYSMADVFVLPTQYDTFGWPPLEAAACGCPVITGDIAPLNVNLRDIALFVEPNDSQQLANLITKVLNNRDFAQQLATKGKIVCERFSWANTADIVLRSLNTVADETIIQ